MSEDGYNHTSAKNPPPPPSTTTTLEHPPIMKKCFERLVKDHMVFRLRPTFNPHQLAYRSNRSTEVSSALQLILEHLEEKNSQVQTLFLDFNTIIPQHLVNPLVPLDFCPPCNWLLDLLTNRPQSVQVGPSVTGVLHLSTGVLQGCVLSPLPTTS